MSTLNFPNNPVNGQEYSAPNDAIYTWNSVQGVWTSLYIPNPPPPPITPSIQTPSILFPANGSTNINITSLTLEGSPYIGLNSPGAHGSSDWQLSVGTEDPLISTNTITSYSQNSSVWENIPTPILSVSDNWVGMAYGNGVYIGVLQTTDLFPSESVKVLRSENLIDWEITPYSPTELYSPNLRQNAVKYVNGKFFMLSFYSGGASGFSYSEDGISWTFKSVATTATPQITDITWGLGQWVAAVGNKVYTLSDPNLSGSFTERYATGVNFKDEVSIDFGEGKFVYTARYLNAGISLYGSIQLHSSVDGVNWTLNDTVSQYYQGTYVVKFGTNFWVLLYSDSIVYYDTKVLKSTDGENWGLTGTIPATIEDLTYGNGKFMAVGYIPGSGLDGINSTSEDGINWTSPEVVTQLSQIRNATFDGSNFVVGGFTEGGGILPQITYLASGPYTLTIAGAQTDGFTVGDEITNGLSGPSAATGTIDSINNTNVVLSPSNGNWAIGQRLYKGQYVINVSSSSNTTSYTVPSNLLATSTTYRVRVKYNSVNNPPVYTSEWSPWSTFTTASSSSTPAIQTPYLVSPSNGEAGVNPSGLTLTGSTYTPLNGAGAVQTSSNWEVYKGSHPLTSTNNITSVTQGTGTWTKVLSNPPGSVIRRSSIYTGTKFLFGGGGGSIVYTYDFVTWVNSTGYVSQNVNGLAYGNGVYVGCGGGNSVASSTDGIGWTPRTSPQNVGTIYYAATFGAGVFVIGGSGIPGSISSSYDGVNWSAQTSNLDGSCYDLSYGNGIFVAVGGNGVNAKCATSPDGVTWTAQTVGGSNLELYSIGFGNGIFMASGVSADFYTSTDGITWTQVANNPPAFGTDTITSIFHGSGVWVAGSSTGILATSTDNGVTWTLETAGTSQKTRGVYGNGTWIQGTTDGIYTSSAPTDYSSLSILGCQTDGFLVGDTVESDPAGAGPATIIAINNTTVNVVPQSNSWAPGQKIKRLSSSYEIVAGSPFTRSSSPFTSLTLPNPLETGETYYARLRYSTTNPIAATSAYSGWSEFKTGWVTRVSGTTNTLNDVTFANNTWVAVGAAGTILTSTDGITWVSRLSGVSTALNTVGWDGSKFVAAGDSGVIITSTNGSVWAASPTAGSSGNSYAGIDFNGSNWIIVGANSSGTQTGYYSSDSGATWTGTSWNGVIGSARDVAYGGGVFVVVTASGQIRRSADNGATWTLPVSATTGGFTNVNYGNGIFLATGPQANGGVPGNIYSSTDGITWMNKTAGGVILNTIYGSAYGAGTWVNVGAVGGIQTSPNTTTWTSQVSGTTSSQYGVAYSSTLGMFVSVGLNGTIVTT